MQFSPSLYHFISLLPKYSPQHPVLKHLVYVPPLMSEIQLHTHIHVELQAKLWFCIF
jgi:hypothetical protein